MIAHAGLGCRLSEARGAASTIDPVAKAASVSTTTPGTMRGLRAQAAAAA